MSKEISSKEIGETLAYIVANMTTKDNLTDAIVGIRAEMATKDDLKRFATKDDLKLFATKDDLKRFATKDDLLRFATQEDMTELRERMRNLERGQNEILDTLRPMSRAQDTDSLAIVDHERRIVMLEHAMAA